MVSVVSVSLVSNGIPWCPWYLVSVLSHGIPWDLWYLVSVVSYVIPWCPWHLVSVVSHGIPWYLWYLVSVIACGAVTMGGGAVSSSPNSRRSHTYTVKFFLKKGFRSTFSRGDTS